MSQITCKISVVSGIYSNEAPPDELAGGSLCVRSFGGGKKAPKGDIAACSDLCPTQTHPSVVGDRCDGPH